MMSTQLYVLNILIMSFLIFFFNSDFYVLPDVLSVSLYCPGPYRIYILIQLYIFFIFYNWACFKLRLMKTSLTSVAPWESCWLTSSSCLSSSWMSPSIRLSVDARVSLIISWVMPANQINDVNHKGDSFFPRQTYYTTAACWQGHFIADLRHNSGIMEQRNNMLVHSSDILKRALFYVSLSLFYNALRVLCYVYCIVVPVLMETTVEN